MEQRKALSKKIYCMMKDNPAEVYRILTIPDYSTNTINAKSASRNVDWSEQHEEIFGELNKRSFTSRSLAKSLIFRDMSKKLPKDLDYPDEKWKFDKNSPWVNDLEHNHENAIAIGENLELKAAKKKGMTNINLVRSVNESFSSETDELRNELSPHFGHTEMLNKITLMKLKYGRSNVQDFKDSYEGF